MAGVLCLFMVGLGASAQKKKSSPGDEPRGAKVCEAACACRSPVTQKSRSQARPPLDALQQSSALASEDYSSQSDEKSNTKPGVGVTLGLYSFMRPASHNNAGVICVVYGGKEHCGYCSYAVLRVCYRFTTLRALQSGKPVKDQRAPVSWWLWCELCVFLLHYSTRDCYSIGYREKEIERDLEVGIYVFEF